MITRLHLQLVVQAAAVMSSLSPEQQEILRLHPHHREIAGEIVLVLVAEAEVVQLVMVQTRLVIMVALVALEPHLLLLAAALLMLAAAVVVVLLAVLEAAASAALVVVLGQLQREV